MSMRLVLSILLLCGSSIVAGQVPFSANSTDKWEVSAGWNVSSGEMTLKNGAVSSDGQHGIGARVLFSVSKPYALGIEGSKFYAQSLFPLVKNYYSYRLGAVLKYNLTPNTNPRVYAVAGIGVTSHHLEYISIYRKHQSTHTIPYLAIGAGIEVNVWKQCFAAAEIRAMYNTRTNVDLFYEMDSRWEADGRIGLGVRF